MWYDNLDIATIRPIAKNVNTIERVRTYMEEVSRLEILPIVGAAQYQNIEQGNVPLTDPLFVGGYYTVVEHGNTITKYQSGLNNALLYLTYSRLILNNQVNVTAFGVVQKKTELSEPIDEVNLIRQANEAEMIGKEYLRQVADYVNSQNDCTCCKKPRVRSVNIKKVGIDQTVPFYRPNMVLGWL